MTEYNAEPLPDDADLVDDYTKNCYVDYAAAIDRIACRLFEHVTGIPQVPSNLSEGELPSEREDAIDLVTERFKNKTPELLGVTLSPQLAAIIAIQMDYFANTLYHSLKRERSVH